MIGWWFDMTSLWAFVLWFLSPDLPSGRHLPPGFAVILAEEVSSQWPRGLCSKLALFSLWVHNIVLLKIPLKRSFGVLEFHYNRFFKSLYVGYWSVLNLKTAKLALHPFILEEPCCPRYLESGSARPRPHTKLFVPFLAAESAYLVSFSFILYSLQPPSLAPFFSWE